MGVVTIFVDPDVSPEELRRTLYGGNLVVLTRLSGVARLVAFAREELTNLFAPYAPELAHEHFDKAQMAQLLSQWKPAFIHSETSRRLVCDIIEEAGLSPERTHFDLPKPRTSFPVGHLTTGIAFAFPWHRDVWYSAPAQQLNWWLPIYPARADNAMSFDLGRFAQAVPNTSAAFDYYDNNAGRHKTTSTVDKEEQSRPGAIDHHPAEDLVVLPAPGQVLLFSGAQLHTSTPNTSPIARYSIDFRTVDVDDLLAGRGAPLVDAHCTGTAIRDFRRVSDDAALPEETVRSIYGEPPEDAMLVFTPTATAPSQADPILGA